MTKQRKTQQSNSAKAGNQPDSTPVENSTVLPTSQPANQPDGVINPFGKWDKSGLSLVCYAEFIHDAIRVEQITRSADDTPVVHVDENGNVVCHRNPMAKLGERAGENTSRIQLGDITIEKVIVPNLPEFRHADKSGNAHKDKSGNWVSTHDETFASKNKHGNPEHVFVTFEKTDKSGAVVHGDDNKPVMMVKLGADRKPVVKLSDGFKWLVNVPGREPYDYVNSNGAKYDLPTLQPARGILAIWADYMGVTLPVVKSGDNTGVTKADLQRENARLVAQMTADKIARDALIASLKMVLDTPGFPESAKDEIRKQIAGLQIQNDAWTGDSALSANGDDILVNNPAGDDNPIRIDANAPISHPLPDNQPE